MKKSNYRQLLSHGEKGLNVKLRNMITITLADESQGIFKNFNISLLL